MLDLNYKLECIKKLKAGYKVLIMGNHDKGVSNYKRIKKVVQKHYLMPGIDVIDKEEDNHLFDEIYEGTLQISPKIILSHEPVEYFYCLNIHGHVHFVNPLGAYTEGINCTSHYNCCAETIGYKPVSLKSFFESGIMKNITDVHRNTIENRKMRKEFKKEPIVYYNDKPIGVSNEEWAEIKLKEAQKELHFENGIPQGE